MQLHAPSGAGVEANAEFSPRPPYRQDVAGGGWAAEGGHRCAPCPQGDTGKIETTAGEEALRGTAGVLGGAIR